MIFTSGQRDKRKKKNKQTNEIIWKFIFIEYEK